VLPFSLSGIEQKELCSWIWFWVRERECVCVYIYGRFGGVHHVAGLLTFVQNSIWNTEEV